MISKCDITYNITYNKIDIRILCSAIWLNDGVKRDGNPINIPTGIVICGYRHSDCIAQLESLGFDICRDNHTMGFLTSDNTFVNRRLGATIANGVGQTNMKVHTLMSENLY